MKEKPRRHPLLVIAVVCAVAASLAALAVVTGLLPLGKDQQPSLQLERVTNPTPLAPPQPPQTLRALPR